MNSVSNPKSHGWDAVGGAFWTLGKQTAKPSSREIALFLDGTKQNDRCCIIGASTIDLVTAACERDINVTVIDFSSRMCADLCEELGRQRSLHPHVMLQDITGGLPSELLGSQDWVLSDRLINRFSLTEVDKALHNMAALLKPNGVLRTSVRLGFYDRDFKLIETAKHHGIADKVFDAATKTIDFGAASAILEEGLEPNGAIPRDVLLQWYKARGRERRYEYEDVRRLFAELTHMVAMAELRSVTFPDAPKTTMYEVRRT